MTEFRYDGAITDRYPVHAGLTSVALSANPPSSPELRDRYVAEQQAVLQRLESTAIAEHDSISAWRRTFTSFGVKPTQHRVAAEALLRRLSKAGDIPFINTLVDIGNLVSIRYALPVAVFDLAEVQGQLTVRFADGSESFSDLGSDGDSPPEPGEVVFVDDRNVVHARRWCWRQSAQSATSADTRRALLVVEGVHATAEDDTTAALADLEALLTEHAPLA